MRNLTQKRPKYDKVWAFVISDFGRGKCVSIQQKNQPYDMDRDWLADDVGDLEDISGLEENLDEEDSLGDGLPDALSQTQTITHQHTVLADEVGMRLDKLCAVRFGEFSRAVLQGLIDAGDISINDKAVKPKFTVRQGDVISLRTVLQAHSEDLPENIPLTICYEDDEVLVINKPAGLVVHPGAGNRTGTLVNALLYHYPEQAHLPRAGLVHRIDKDTTGLLMVAKTASAQLALIEALKSKQVYRHYQCVVAGDLPSLARHRTIDAPIARHATQRTKMAVRSNGKPAVTHILHITPLGTQYCLLDVALETGRTHQIRVHLSHVGHGLVGDKTYPTNIKKGLSDAARQAVQSFPRQALHAHTLGFIRPATGEQIKVTAPLPDDMAGLIDVLSQES